MLLIRKERRQHGVSTECKINLFYFNLFFKKVGIIKTKPSLNKELILLNDSRSNHSAWIQFISDLQKSFFNTQSHEHTYTNTQYRCGKENQILIIQFII